MFRVFAKDYDRQFERWTDALDAGNSLKSKCKSLFQDVRIFYGEELIWVYSRLHTNTKYIGAGVYDKLARLFILENTPEVEVEADEPQS